MHALWLASWYPNATDPYNGDFIQRHAQALATRIPVTVIHIAKAPLLGSAEGQRLADGPHSSAKRATGAGPSTAGLTEKLCYVKAPATPVPALNKLLNQLRAFRAFKKVFQNHVQANGKPSFIHLHVCMNAGLFALWVKRRYSIPYIVTEHYTAYIPESLESYETRPWTYRWLNKRILSKAIGVTSVSGYMLDQMRAITPLVQEAVIPNTVDTHLFNRQNVAPLSTAPFKFIHVSTMVEHKNVKGILEALARVDEILRKSVTLELVGPKRPELLAYAKELGLEEQVTWTGEIPYAQVSQHMKQAQALILFSRFENQPCVISEALCTGLPVISSRVGGISEVIDDRNGLLVEKGNVEALTAAMEKMINQSGHWDPESIARCAASEHSYAQLAEEFLGYYERLGFS